MSDKHNFSVLLLTVTAVIKATDLKGLDPKAKAGNGNCMYLKEYLYEMSRLLFPMTLERFYHLAINWWVLWVHYAPSIVISNWFQFGVWWCSIGTFLTLMPCWMPNCLGDYSVVLLTDPWLELTFPLHRVTVHIRTCIQSCSSLTHQSIIKLTCACIMTKAGWMCEYVKVRVFWPIVTHWHCCWLFLNLCVGDVMRTISWWISLLINTPLPYLPIAILTQLHS